MPEVEPSDAGAEDANDASTPTDAPFADSDLDALPTSPCAAAHTWCCDFDDAALAACFDAFTVTSGDTFEISDAQSVSPQNSLHALVTNVGTAWGTKPLAGHTSVTCTFEMFLQSITTANIMLTNLDTSSTSPVARMFVGPGDGGVIALLEGYTDGGYALANGSLDLPVSTWIGLALTFNINHFGIGTAAISTVDVDAALTLTGNTAPATSFTLRLGVSNVGSGKQGEIYIDNIVCDAK